MKILAFDIGGTYIKGALFQKKQRILTFEEPTAQTKTRFLKQIENIIETLLSRHSIKALGIGIPGPFKDYKKGIIGNLPNLPLHNVPLKDKLSKRYHIPLIVENDANCFVLGEWLFNKAKGYQHVIGITLGTGMGIGIIANNQLYKGRGNAGEFSHAPYQKKVFEEYISKRAILAYAKARKIKKKEPKELASKKYQSIWEQFGEHLGKAMSILHQTLDPEIIVIGGQLAKAHRLFLPMAKKTLRQQITLSPPKIAISTTNYSLEAAAWLAEQTLKKEKNK